MRCTRCGAIIPDDQMICPECGAEVQIVPDYNPLDDVLTREVKGSVEGATRQLHTEDIRRQQRPPQPRNINSTRVISQNEMDRLRDARRAAARRNGAQSGGLSGSRTSNRSKSPWPATSGATARRSPPRAEVRCIRSNGFLFTRFSAS